MTGEDMFEDGPTPPRVVEALLPMSNYIRGNTTRQMNGYTSSEATLETDAGYLRFEINEARDSHGTSAKISGFGSEEIVVFGLPLLYSDKKILLEVWNDGELNCWCEYDLEARTEVFLRRNELDSYLSRYVQDSDVRDAYFRDIERIYGTESLNYCHYYFESDKVEDRHLLLDRCSNIKSLEGRWSLVKEIAERHLNRNERQSTWRGLCVLWLANELFFKGSEIEPRLRAEYDLLGNTALSWGGHSQKELIRRARRYLPFVTQIFERTTEVDRSREVWKVAYHQVLIGLIFREVAQQGNERLEDLKWLMKKATGGDDADKRIAKLFLAGLPATGLLSRLEKKVLRGTH